ncbi:MAG: ABC transporter ATP-binding protein [Salinarimonadaceae bacterium]|nr:MAG: ABC transporter ATP-binding protein [Salinarimonadaceae bacterium]
MTMDDGETPILQVRGLRTYFETDLGVGKAVDDVSFTLRRGQIIGLVGESGSGKSVTGQSLIGLVDRPGRIVGGEILFKGRDMAKLAPEELRRLRGDRISIIFQDPMTTLNPVLSIGTQLIETVLAHYPSVTPQKARERARDMLGKMGIPNPEERLDAYPHQYSGGMRQRVAIAMALINDPECVIADEPTTALDVTIQSQIAHEVKDLCRNAGTALIWITHDLGLVAALADDICVMYAGRIVERGRVEDVLGKPLHPYTRGLMDAVPSRNKRGVRLSQIPGSMPPLLALPGGCAFHPRCWRADQSDCRVSPPEESPREDGGALRCHHPLEDSIVMAR